MDAQLSLFPNLPAAAVVLPASALAATDEVGTYLDDEERFGEPPGYWATWEERFARDVGVSLCGAL